MNSTPHTSHFFVDSHLMTRTCAAQAQIWRAQRTFHVISCVIFMRSCCVFDSLRRLHSLLFAVCLLSYRLIFPFRLQLLLPRCGGQIPCALLVMRTLAPLPSTTLSHLPQWSRLLIRIKDFVNESDFTPFSVPLPCTVAYVELRDVIQNT